MDILIKDWRLPESCSDCPFYSESVYGDMNCVITGEELQCDMNGKFRTDFKYYSDRSPKCPLSEVK